MCTHLPQSMQGWPSTVRLDAFDMCARKGGGVWMLDRTHLRLWELDCKLTVVLSGQPATTIIVAQSIAGRNGFKIQNDAAMRPTMNSTERLDLVRSCGVVDALIGILLISHRLVRKIFREG